MRYHYKKPDRWTWTQYDTDSLEADVAAGRIGADWRIRRDGEGTDYLPRELIAAEAVARKQAVDDKKRLMAKPLGAWFIRGDQIQPLLDPTRVTWRFLIILALIGGVRIFARLMSSTSIEALDVLVLVAFSCPLIAHLSLLTPERGPKVFYLRAFRSDLDSQRLRASLRAILGPNHHLTGIRPPREHSYFLIRILFTLWDGFRSLGSPYFELEADDRNWIVRLLASYRDGRFVFIDLRDLTPFVEDEIRLSYLAFGLHRCIFVADAKLEHDAACATVSAIVGDSAMDAKEIMLLRYSDGLPFKEVKDQVSASLKLIPNSRTEIAPAAIDFASERVPIQKWRTRFRDTERGRLIYILIAQGLLGFLVAFVTTLIVGLGDDPTFPTWQKILVGFGYALALGSFLGFFAALSRARKQAQFEREHQSVLGRPPARERRLRFACLFGSLGALLNVPVINVFIWLSVSSWMGSLFPAKALSGEFHTEHATYDFSPIGTFTKRDWLGKWTGIYIIHGDKVEISERLMRRGDHSVLTDVHGSELSLKDITAQGIRVTNRPAYITDNWLLVKISSHGEDE